MRLPMKAVAAGLLALLLVAPAHSDEDLRRSAAAMFGMLSPPPSGEIDAPIAQLGRKLFWDDRVSANRRVACASCHLAADGSSDRRRQSIDARDKPTARHSQPIFNAMLQPALRWTSDRADGAAQAEASITGSMGFADKAAAVEAMRNLGYEREFAWAFPGDATALSAANYGRALQAYQRTLVTPAPFDRFLAGDAKALTPQQRTGLQAFIAAGCAGCHNGVLLGGRQLQKFGLVKDYWTETRSEKIDDGRFLVTKNEADRHVFRVPMLRNVAMTAPYFHDGSIARLDDAVRVMASVQLGRQLPAADVAAIVAFLESLSGEVPTHYAPPREPLVATEYTSRPHEARP